MNCTSREENTIDLLDRRTMEERTTLAGARTMHNALRLEECGARKDWSVGVARPIRRIKRPSVTRSQSPAPRKRKNKHHIAP